MQFKKRQRELSQLPVRRRKQQSCSCGLRALASLFNWFQWLIYTLLKLSHLVSNPPSLARLSVGLDLAGPWGQLTAYSESFRFLGPSVLMSKLVYQECPPCYQCINLGKKVHKKISGLPLFKHAQTRNFFFSVCSIVLVRRKKKGFKAICQLSTLGTFRTKQLAEHKVRRLIWALCQLPEMLSYLFWIFVQIEKANCTLGA